MGRLESGMRLIVAKVAAAPGGGMLGPVDRGIEAGPPGPDLDMLARMLFVCVVDPEFPGG
jgi:hypothetical protein